MRATLVGAGPGGRFVAEFFDEAPAMIAWLGAHLEECALISLDHDLGPSRRIDEEFRDPGTGRDVADFLAARKPACPVIVHTSNPLARVGMELALQSAGWKVVRVYPQFDTDWIGTHWLAVVLELLRP
jgi:hypothetical protein